MLSTDSSTKQLSGVIIHHTAKDLTYVYRSQHDDEWLYTGLFLMNHFFCRFNLKKCFNVSLKNNDTDHMRYRPQTVLMTGTMTWLYK
jgi:hypothetical protein